MEIILSVITIVGLTYWLANPIKRKKSPGRPRKPKQFGDGMFQDHGSWWGPGDGGQGPGL